MASIIDENNSIIEEIEELIKLLDVETKENYYIELLTKNKFDEVVRICDEKLAFKARERIDFFLSRIIAVNEVTIGKHVELTNRIQQIYIIQSIPCNIRFMDMPINNSIFVVQLFYRKLYEKYGGTLGKYIALGLYKISDRELNLDALSCSENIIADELNILISYFKFRKQLEALIDLCKSINCNYCEIQ